MGVSSDSPSTPSLDRRSLLGTVAASGIGTLSGCSTVAGLLDDDVEPPERRVPADWNPAPGDWPTRHYGYARSNHNPYASPPRSEPRVDWEVDAGGPVDAMVVADGYVFVRTGETVLAFDARTGDERWRRSAQGDRGFVEFVDGWLYTGNRNRLTALTPAGEERWSTEIPESSVWGYFFIEREGWVFLFSPGGTRRLHADTGEVVGRSDRSLYRTTTDGGPVYGGRTTMRAYDVEGRTLDERWTTSSDGYETYGVPAVDDGLVYRGTNALSASESEPRGRFSVYDASDGTEVATVPFQRTPQTPAVDDGVAYVATSGVGSENIGEDGLLAAVAQDGTERWRFEPDAGLQFPVVADDTVYARPFRGSGAPLVALDADSGDELWRRDRVVSDPELAVADETLYVAGGSKVVALRD
jgi:outer membrane protein assembly factor BamB